ncbi:MAG: hypothetical protein CSA11_09880 [Chloroflexi bacterium]|nr:MAG: hypothetical protein CSB13_09115 [Chloroflexota bacterium]PIE79960.1 MAG: hypothetical protein CSA11_09880 [Chloroflexota bacterium]
MTKDIFYKVSFVVAGGKHPGAIMTVESKPAVGDEVSFNGSTFTVTEVMELMPTVGNFGFLHVTCEFLRESETEA